MIILCGPGVYKASSLYRTSQFGVFYYTTETFGPIAGLQIIEDPPKRSSSHTKSTITPND